MNKFVYVFFCISVYIFFSCNTSTPSQSSFMVFDDVEYVTEFRQSYNLSKKTVPDINVIGITDLSIYESNILFSTKKTDSLWAVFTLPEYDYRGSILSKGNGPFEFVQSPEVGYQTKLFKEKGELVAGVYDSQKGKVFKVKIGRASCRERV